MNIQLENGDVFEINESQNGTKYIELDLNHYFKKDQVYKILKYCGEIPRKNYSLTIVYFGKKYTLNEEEIYEERFKKGERKYIEPIEKRRCYISLTHEKKGA